MRNRVMARSLFLALQHWITDLDEFFEEHVVVGTDHRAARHARNRLREEQCKRGEQSAVSGAKTRHTGHSMRLDSTLKGSERKGLIDRYSAKRRGGRTSKQTSATSAFFRKQVIRRQLAYSQVSLRVCCTSMDRSTSHSARRASSPRCRNDARRPPPDSAMPT